VYVTPSGLGFSQGIFDRQASPWRWAFHEPISHPFVPFSATGLSHALHQDRDKLQDFLDGFTVQTESFQLFGEDEPSATHFAYLYSPVAEFRESFSHYIEALKSGRRKEARRLLREYDEDPSFVFALSEEPITSQETDYLLTMTRKRWGAEGWQYAATQTLWVQATIMTNPAAARFMRVYHEGTLVLLAGYIVRGNVITSQSTCRNEDKRFSGLGTMVDFKTIQLLHDQNNIRVLDPTCRTGLEDPPSIGMAKREVVNADRVRPLLIISNNNQDDLPCYSPAKGEWNSTDTPTIIGQPA
jgi:hypothetical protein